MIFLTIFLNYLLNWGCQLAVVGWVIALANIRINPNQFLSYHMSLNEYIFANLRWCKSYATTSTHRLTKICVKIHFNLLTPTQQTTKLCKLCIEEKGIEKGSKQNLIASFTLITRRLSFMGAMLWKLSSRLTMYICNGWDFITRVKSDLYEGVMYPLNV